MEAEITTKVNRADEQFVSARTVRQVICFGLGEETFAVDIYQVQEIIHIPHITRIPGTRQFVEGAINLRGKIVPVMDLRKRFGLTPTGEHTRKNRIMVLTVHSNPVGLIVDFVNQVLQLTTEMLTPVPEMTLPVADENFIESVASVNDELIMILDVNNIYTRVQSEAPHNNTGVTRPHG
ncbi:MAG: chemotaxis protein CheW [Candidatus Marinimicrobia bacterium]|nr:chemotaxis protein CheW [Candidatus Neomarinimicrobiota bacterium]MCF7841060.1 chemotaxis protein CheW [Candidatus Neomarinimicrobiota bacterium]